MPLTAAEIAEFKARSERIPYEHCIFTGAEMARVLRELTRLRKAVDSAVAELRAGNCGCDREGVAGQG